MTKEGTKKTTQENEVILVYGQQFGWYDVESLKKFLDAHCCLDCWLYLETAPVERVERELETDHRIQMRITKNPRKAAKKYLDELKKLGKTAEIKRLEEISDRSMNRGGC